MEVLEQLEAALVAVAELTGPSVVGLGGGWGSGSGVVVGEDRILTNAHNLRADRVDVTFADGSTAVGEAEGVDLDGDLAVVSVPTGQAPPVSWPDAGTEPRLGSVVFALANPGGRGVRTTFGTVSAVARAFRGPRGRRISGGIEHTAPLTRGSSGGPIVDGEGRLIGINTHRLGDGFYLALPADAPLRGRVDALARGEAPTRQRLGVGLAPSSVAKRLRASVGLPERDGLLVRHVEEDSPAAVAGLRSGDLLVTAGGEPVTDADALFTVLDGLDPGSSLELGLVRGEQEVSVRVTFAQPTSE